MPPPSPPPRLLFLAPPGAGKSTQAARIARRIGVPHISSGQLLRRESTRGSGLGRRVRPYVVAGELVPDELAVGVIARRLRRPDARGGFILDGFPRTEAQAAELGQAMGDPGLLVHLRLDEDGVVRRLGGRRTCPEGHVYHIELSPPRATDRCDLDGLALSTREDDRPRVVRNRIRRYRAETEPLVSLYRRRGRLVEVDGGGAVNEVTSAILLALAAAGVPVG
jgi:adenylate kinase